MNPHSAKNEHERLKGQTTFQRNVIDGLLGLCFAMACGWGWTVMNSTVAIVPPEIRRPYEIGAGHGNKEYLADMANYVLDQVLTVSPDSIDHNNTVILKMAHPDGYGKLKAELEGAALRIKRDRISTVWTPRKESVFERDNVVRVSGFQKTYIADVLASTRDREYLVEFTITSSGRLYVLRIEEVVKPDANRPATDRRTG
jgi:conjugal transfer pilus assembly protein TraE